MNDTKQTTLFIRETDEPDGACLNWADCSNYPTGHPNSNNKLCDKCLDEIRHRDAEADYTHYPTHLRSVAGSE